MPKASIESLLRAIEGGTSQAIYLVSGDLVVSEPAGRRLAEALAAEAGCEIETFRRPSLLGPILADLRTYSLFSSAKVALVTESSLLVDRRGAAELIDQAEDALPVEPGMDLGEKQRLGASRLLQALRVFGVDPRAGGNPSETLGALPKWALQGGKALRKKKPRGRPAKEVKELQNGLAALLDEAIRVGMFGFADGDLAELGGILESGLPDHHSLVLVESTVASDHPVVEGLLQRGAMLELQTVGTDRGGQWQGLNALTEELARETGVVIAPDAVQELARRTLRQVGEWKNRRVDAESTARLAGEYRKLASLATAGTIQRQLVVDAVEDRGEEDVWQILDAVGNGRGEEAMARFRRLIGSADDVMATRLSFFSLLATFCRQLAAVGGIARLQSVPAGVRSYQQFKNRWAPALQGSLPDGMKNPLAGLHPFRLHRAYLAASQIRREELSTLPWRVLETELQIKGESSRPDVAISRLLAHLASLVKAGA